MDLLDPINPCKFCCSSSSPEAVSDGEGATSGGSAVPHRAQKFASSALFCSQEGQAFIPRGYTILMNHAQGWSHRGQLSFNLLLVVVPDSMVIILVTEGRGFKFQVSS